MKRRELLAVVTAGTIAYNFPSKAQVIQTGYTKEIALPKPNATGAVSLEEAIGRRRSVRTFGPGTVPVGTIGQLLWAGQGVTSQDGKRAAPSAGALYALELYAVTATEVMHYLPKGHRAESRPMPDVRATLKSLALGQESVGAAPVVIVVASDPSRLAARYGDRAKAYSDIEVGHAAQNILLQAVVLGLGAVPVAALDGTQAARALALASGQTVAYLIPVGAAA